MRSRQPSLDADGWESALDDERARVAARARAARRHHRELDTAEASLLGTLWDLAERRAEVVVQTIAGRRVQGALEQVGADFVTVTAGGHAVHLAVAGLATVQPGPTSVHRDATGMRPHPTDLCLRDLLADLATARGRVSLRLRGHDAPMSGTLTAAGRDVLSVAPDGAPGERRYVSLSAVLEVVDFGSG